MKKKTLSTLEQVKKKHPNLPLETQKSIARIKNLQVRAKRLRGLGW